MLFYELNCATSIEALTPQIWLYLEIKKVINVKWGHKGVVLFWEEGCCCCCWVASVVSDSVRPYRQQPTRLRRPWDSPGKNPGVDCHFLLQCMKVKRESEVTQSSPTLSDPMDFSPPSMGFFRQEYWSGVPLPSLLERLYAYKSKCPSQRCRLVGTPS